MKPKVYVTQEMGFTTLRLAAEFGELTILSDGRRDDFTIVTNSESNERLIAHLRQGLRDFDFDKDFIVFIGSPYVQAAVSVLLGKMGARRLNMLKWDRDSKVYIPLRISFD